MHCRDGGTVFYIFEIKQQRQPAAVSLTAIILRGDVNFQSIPEGRRKQKGESRRGGSSQKCMPV